MKQLILIFFLLITLVSSCIDPYYLELEDYESLLVVESMITDEVASYTIKLSRTFQNTNTFPEKVTRAEVNVRDEMGLIAAFQELEPGIYKSDPMLFTGRVGGTYSLHIKTEDGLEYASDRCTMTAVPQIDSIYYEVDSEYYDNGKVEEVGLRIYLDADNQEVACQYMRWDFEEVWKFRIPYPIFHQDLGYKEYKTKHVENDICWRYEQSKQILIHSSAEQSSDRISRKSVHFIASGRSNRLLRQYSILVRQYSLSQEEFSFWNKLKEITESEGDIFEKEPFPVAGNINCINNKQEKVLGYFQVSAIRYQRIYITQRQVNELGIPLYEYPCERIVYPTRQLHERIYENLLFSGYVLFWVEEDDFGLPVSWQFSSAECTDCSLNGNPERPEFWVDME